MKDNIVCEIVKKYIKHSVDSAAGKVPECLSWYQARKGAMEKINSPYNYVSYSGKQSIKLRRKDTEIY
jgi:hypothetical protein